MSFEGATIEESISALKTLKVQHEVVAQARSWENLINLLKERQGVVMARVIGTKGVGAHRIVVEAAKDGVRIIDRSGIYGTLEDLSSRYALNGGKWVIDATRPAVFVKAVTVRVIKGAPTLMGYVNALFPNLQGHYTTQNLDAQMQKFKAQSAGKRQSRSER